MSSYVDVYNKNEDILVLGEGPTQDLDQTIIAASSISYRIYTIRGENVLNLHCNRSNTFLFVNAVKMHQFKAKNFEIRTIFIMLM